MELGYIQFMNDPKFAFRLETIIFCERGEPADPFLPLHQKLVRPLLRSFRALILNSFPIEPKRCLCGFNCDGLVQIFVVIDSNNYPVRLVKHPASKKSNCLAIFAPWIAVGPPLAEVVFLRAK